MTAPYNVAAGNAAPSASPLVLTAGTGLAGSTGVAAGDSVVVTAVWNSGSVSSVTDSKGGTYVNPVSAIAQTSKCGHWVRVGGPALVSGTDTITVTYSNNVSTQGAIARACAGVAGIDTSPPCVAAGGSSAAPSSGSTGTLTQAQEWLVAGLANGNGGGQPSAWTGGFTAAGSEHNGTATWLTVADQVTAATTAVTAAATTASTNWDMALVALLLSSPVITTTTLPGGVLGAAYDELVTETGGAGTLTWSVTAGALPAGLSLNTATGEITGTPTAAGTASFTIQVADGSGNTASQPLSIAIAGAPSTWAFVQKSASQASGSGSATASLPAASTAGNLLVASLMAADTTSAWTLPAGWAVAPGTDTVNGTNASRTAIAYLVDTAGGTTSATFGCGTTSVKAFLSEFTVAGTISLNATGGGIAGKTDNCPVTTGTVPGAGDLVIVGFEEHFSSATAVTWTDPAGFTLIGSDGGSNANHQYAAYQLSAPGGAQTVTGKSSAVSTSGSGWTGAMATFTNGAAPSTGGGGTAGLVGSNINPNSWAPGGTMAQVIQAWTALTQRPLTVHRVYYQPGVIPAGITTDLTADLNAGRKVVMSMKPDYNPVNASQLAAIDNFLHSCKAAGLVADVVLWHEAYTEGLTGDQYKAMIAYYGPTVRQYYPLVYSQSSYPVLHKNANANFYPGDAAVDKVNVDFYASGYVGGDRLDGCAAIADNASPPKPFCVFEFNASTITETQAQGTEFLKYIRTFFAARLAAGKVNGDLCIWDDKGQLGYSITDATDYRLPLYQDIFDTLNGAGAPSGTQTWHVSAALSTVTSFTAGASGGTPPPPPPPPPPVLPPVAPVIASQASWTFGAGPRQPAGGISLALTEARSRSVTFRTPPDSYHEASFVIDGRHPQAAAFHELTTDLVLYRDDQLMGVMRIVPTQDDLDDTSHTVTVSAVDYRQVLRRRLLFPDDNLFWDSTDQASIAWQMITETQARPGGNLGISRGTGQSTGQQRDYEANAGDFVGDSITRIAQMSGGFDWDITPYGPADLRLDIWSPQRGADRGVILEYGSALVQQVTRAVDPTTFANSWLVTGNVPSPQPGPVAATQFFGDEPGIGSDPAGRWDQVQGTQLKNQDAIRARLAWHLAESVTVVPAYTIVLQPGAWGGPGHIWLGDLVTVRIKSGRLAVNDRLRVMEIAVAIGDDGDETVTVSAGRIPWRLEKHIPLMLRRLRALETL